MSAQPHDEGATRALTPGSPAAGREIYHGVLGEIAQHCGTLSEADPVGVYATLLAACGATIGPRAHVDIHSTRHPLLIWPLLIGPTGSGRKGTAHGQAMRYANTADPRLTDITLSGLSSGEGLIARIADIIEDTSVATKDAPAGTDDKRIFVAETEFSTVMSRAGRENNTLAAILRQAWEGDALHVLTKTSVHASTSHIAVAGHITPREFTAKLSATDMAGGTFNRFLPVWVQRSRMLASLRVVEDTRHGPLCEELAAAIAGASRVGRITLDDDAERLWENLYGELGDLDENERWVEFSQRAAPYTLRIAALLAALDSRAVYANGRWDATVVDHVSPAHLTAAHAVVRYSMATAAYVLGPNEVDPDYARVLRAVQTAGELTRNSIGRLFSTTKRARILDAIIAQAEADPRLSVTTEETQGRPVTIVRTVAITAVRASGNNGNTGPVGTYGSYGNARRSQEAQKDGSHLTNGETSGSSRVLGGKGDQELVNNVHPFRPAEPPSVAITALRVSGTPDPAWAARMADEPQPIDYEESP